MNLFDCHTHKLDVFGISNIKFNSDHFPSNSFSTGLHPWDVSKEISLEEISSYFEKCHGLKNFVAIGEVGLDKMKGEPLAVQEEYFRFQIKLAIRLKKPVIIHCVRAYEQCLSILKNESVSIPVIFHDFNASFDIYQKLIQQGHYISLGKNFLRNNSKINTYLKKLSCDHLFFETDDSEKNISVLYEKFSSLTGASLDELSEQVNQNKSRVF